MSPKAADSNAHGSGIFPANSQGDDIVVFDDEERQTIRQRFQTLRQQNHKPPGRFNMALSDFLAPEGTADWLGGFCVSTGFGVPERAEAARGLDGARASIAASPCREQVHYDNTTGAVTFLMLAKSQHNTAQPKKGIMDPYGP